MSNGVANSKVDALLGQEAFRLRMEEQCVQIQQYRQAMLRERGHLLSSDEAALEWIERYAAAFD